MRFAAHFLLGSFLCASLRSTLGRGYSLSDNQAQASKPAQLVYYKPTKDVPKMTTAEPSTEPSQDNQGQQYYIGENYYTEYKSNAPAKYPADYPAGPASEGPDTGEYANTTPATPTNPADIHGHLEAILKAYLQSSKTNSPKFLLLLPLSGKGAKPPSPPDYPATVKPRPRKKTKYIVVSS